MPEATPLAAPAGGAHRLIPTIVTSETSKANMLKQRTAKKMLIPEEPVSTDAEIGAVILGLSTVADVGLCFEIEKLRAVAALGERIAECFELVGREAFDSSEPFLVWVASERCGGEDNPGQKAQAEEEQMTQRTHATV